jgi:hypothetical protein
MPADVTDNTEKSRFELDLGGQITFATYRRDGDALVIRHVEAPPALRGKGAADKLMQGIVEIARAEGLKIVPRCSYAYSWMRRHKAYQDLLA